MVFPTLRLLRDVSIKAFSLLRFPGLLTKSFHIKTDLKAFIFNGYFSFLAYSCIFIYKKSLLQTGSFEIDLQFILI